MPGRFWWIRQIILVLFCCLFLFHGIQVLILAYQLDDPFSFLMTFFASNLMILISATLLVGFILRMVNACRKIVDEEEQIK